jgi:hypothetical protein
MKKKIKQRFAYGVVLISTIIVVFNNMGQTLQLVNIPFTKTALLWTGVFSFISGAVWTLYLKGVLK